MPFTSKNYENKRLAYQRNNYFLIAVYEEAYKAAMSDKDNASL